MQIDDTALFPPEPATQRRRPSRRPATGGRERAAIAGLAGAAAVGAAVAGAAPSGAPAADAVLTGAAAAVVVLAGSRARRSTWVWMAGVATIAAPDLTSAGVGAVALAVAVAAQVLDRRTRLLGALVAALAVQVLVRLGDAGPHGFTLLVAALATVPLLVSGYRVAPRRVRRRIHVVAIAAAAVAALALVGFVVATAVATGRVDEGMRQARAGLEAARDGDDREAAAALADSATALDDAHAVLGAWWATPARGLPVVGHQVQAARVATAEGAALAAVASDAALQVPVSDLVFEGGRLDLGLVAAAQGPLATTAEALEAADAELAAVDSPWIVSPLAGRLDELRSEVASALPDARLARDVAAVAPAVLGGDGPRRYFVVFTTPAEARGLGGFMGNWAELTAVDGKLTLARSGRTQELRDATPADSRVISATVDGEVDQRMVEYLDRYGTSQPWDALQDVTMSPDLPTVAEVLRQLYPQAGGAAIDGVLLVDPRALAALMRFTGPIRIDGVRQPLTARNAEEFLLVDQYEVADTDERVDLLEEASRKVFEELTTGDLPNPREVASRLSPLVDEGRLGLVSFHDDEQSLFSSLGLSGAAPAPDGTDGFGLVTINGGQNKIDVYLERDVAYRVEVDPDTGALEARAVIELTNDVPSLDLPDAVVGSNDQDLPRGTNEALVSFYSPHRLVGATLDGAPVGVGSERELGWWVYSTRVRLAPGATARLALALEGQVAPFEVYDLVHSGQPLVVDDEVEVEVVLPDGWGWEGGGDLVAGDDDTGATVRWVGPEDRRARATVVAP